MKKVAIILNGISLKKKFFYKRILPPLSKAYQTDVFETRTIHDAIYLASKAVDKEYDVIIAAGGDGTLNQVLNGMLQTRETNSDLPILGVIPMGSGNDFARSLNITTDVNALIALIHETKRKNLDVGKVQYTTNRGKTNFSYFINVADAGMGPEVVNKLMDSDRLFGSGVAYYLAILSTFFSYKSMKVKIKSTDWEWEEKMRTVAIANGKFYGHGLCVAPDAKLDDGLFSAFLCGDVSVFEFIWYSGQLKNSQKINHPKIEYTTAKDVELSSDELCRIEADGELLGYLPATIQILPGRIKFLC